MKEFLQRYLEEYASAAPTILIDLTAMPTLISSMLTDWGYADSGIEHKIGLLLVSDRDTRLPLFFKLVPGNRTSVSLLDETLDEIRAYKISKPFLVLDRGFFSTENLVKVKNRKMGFIIGLPATTTLFDTLVEKIIPTIQTLSNAFMLNGNYHFGSVEKVKMETVPLYAYVILNPERKTREEKEFYSKLLGRVAYLEGRKRKRKVAGRFVEFKYGRAKMKEEEIQKELKRKGVMILLSTRRMECAEALDLYYSRDIIEKNFRYFKSDLNLLPARVHREDGVRAYVLLMFISLCLLLQLKKVKLPMSLTEGFLLLRMVKRKIYDEGSVVVGVGKEQKEIFEKFGCIMPK
jgi:transposase